MLRKIRIQEIEHETLELDDYIPFNVYWKTPFAFPIQYWRTGDLEKSLIEMGINSESGELLSITLTMLHSVSYESPIFLHSKKDIDQFGIPVFDISAWENIRFIDEPIDFQSFFFNGRLIIALDDKKTVASMLSSEHIKFYFDSNHFLIAFELGNLSEEEVLQLNKHCNI
ncbi:hypothetical protein [Brevibacillus laterosporus]|uniref:Uncharacterized protein n=1 Tax=Brevibacillus laterosporus TaxID=1465 RepID=A0AAP3DM48_BRELA|nr:hypothetical protein [Brevibacillus laterosporus]MCR8982539.1 hypothetical protein [Brevibacillus laterosporus]MCZ0809695.1 hypothetical protein [Brevibacillus laterosporus]MCZ0828228.1 hypothetical protein [Brevibacillus laterosporus]MCZ0852250.1 hypothetical protein [Brevibacillus laterosporus]